MKRSSLIAIICTLAILCAMLLLVIFLPILTNRDRAEMLTLDDVVELSDRGPALSWGDFEEFEHEAVRTAQRTIWDFPVAEPGFSLSIDGGSVNESPANILLFNQAGESIEVRTGDVLAFIGREADDQPPAAEPPTQPPAPPPTPDPPPPDDPPEPPAPDPTPTYSVVASPSSYDVSAEYITVVITNTSQVDSGFGLNYRIDRNVNGNWQTVPLNFVVPSILVNLPAGQSVTQNFSLHQNQHNYQAGTYRIVFLGSLGGASVQFTLTGGVPTYSVAAQPQSFPVTAEYITVAITNTSQVEGGYGLGYRIEKRINGNWELVPLNFAVIDIFMILPPGQTNTETFNLHQDQFYYQPGTYRIVLTGVAGEPSAQFTLQ